MKPYRIVVACLALVAVACGGSEAERIAELERQVADLEDQAESTTPPTSLVVTDQGLTTLTAPTTSSIDDTSTSTRSAPSTTSAVDETSVVTVEGAGRSIEELDVSLTNQVVWMPTINGGIISLQDETGHQVGLLIARDNYDGGELRLRDPTEVVFIDVDPDSEDPWSITFRPLAEEDQAEITGVVSGEGDDVVWLVGSADTGIVTVDGSCNAGENIYVQIYDDAGRYVGSGRFQSEDGDLPGELLVAEGAALLEMKAFGCTWELQWP